MKKNPLGILAAVLASLTIVACGGGTTGGEGTESGGAASAPARARPQPMVVAAGTTLDVRLNTGLNSKDNKAGDPFEGELDNAVVLGERVAIPKGSAVRGHVTNAVKSGRLKGRAELWVALDEITVRGKAYQLASSTEGHKEGSKTTRNIIFIGGGAGGGAAIGGAAGGGKGAGIGAAIGAGAGTAAAMLTGQRDVKFPPETVLRFELQQELRIQP